MVAGPNGLVLKIFSNTGQIQNMFQIWAKNKKNSRWVASAGGSRCRTLGPRLDKKIFA
jgi:hypothetical protein